MSVPNPTRLALLAPIACVPRIAPYESGAIGELRAVASAQTAYASSNRGAYGRMQCLAAPSSCSQTGLFCFTADGSVPPIENGALSTSCTPLP